MIKVRLLPFGTKPPEVFEHEAGKELKGNFGASTKSRMQKFSDAINGFGLGKEKIHFVENLAILLNSGLTVLDALKTIQMELRVKPMKKIIQKVTDEVRINRTVKIYKARNGRGAGQELGFIFGAGMMFAEQGVICKTAAAAAEAT